MKMSSLVRLILARATGQVNLTRSTARNLSISAYRFEKGAASPSIVTPTAPVASKTVEEEAAKNASHIIGGRRHSPNNLEKRFLVWSGKYKSVDDVPSSVSQETMEKSRNKARIRIANVMILATILSCIGVVISGKRAAKRGESVQQMNLDWHRQIKEDARAAADKQ